MNDVKTAGARPLLLVLFAAAGTFALTMGARQSMGLFVGSINTQTGLGIGSVSLAFAFGQLWWGLTQPLAGIVTDRYGPGRVLLLGVLLVAAGTALIPLMNSTGGLIFAIGVLAAGGAGMAGPATLMAATTRLVPADKRGLATGVVNAGGSFGQFVFAPLAQAVTAAAGWMAAVQTLAALTLLALPAAWVLRAPPRRAASAANAAGAQGSAAADGNATAAEHGAAAGAGAVDSARAAAAAAFTGGSRAAPMGAASAFAEGTGAAAGGAVVPAAAAAATGGGAAAALAATPTPTEGTGAAIRRAFADPSYRLLATGFFVCGFHVAFLATHLPGVVAACGLPLVVGAWALAVLGLFNIVGSIGIGWLIGAGPWRMKSLLSAIYAVRAVAVLAFVLAPKTTPVLLVFAAVMGVTFLSTVPPTAGLVARFFGPTNMATLFGLVMVSHQIGGFLGAWLGGKAFEATGSYDWIWYADIVLAVAAALIHWPIKEAAVERRHVAAGAA